MADRPTETRAIPVPKLFGDFEVVRELGRGSMGVVYEAIQHPLERRVALKTFTAAGRSEQALERFKREANAAAKLSHPGIVPVWAVGEEGGTHYYAMQLVEGKTLRELVYEQGGLEPRRAATIARRIADALDYAHERGVIHRDLKPANIIITGEDRPVITDFGLAKNLALTKLTVEGSVLGTPTHMSPEQARGELDIDRRADVYGLGACLYEMLTARLPFYAGNVTDILKLVIEAPPEPPRRVKPEIPADLEAIVLRCMEKDRERRYDTAGEVGRELERFIRGEPVRAGRGGGARRARSVVLALLLAAAAGAGGFFAGRASAPGASGAAPEAAGAVPAAQGAPRGPIDDPAAARTAEAKRLVEAGQGALARAERGSGPDAARAEAEAIEAFGAALGLSPGSPDALAGLASIYLRRGRDAEMRGDGALAAAFFELVRSHDPGGLYAPALGTTATLSIRTAPGGARIAVDRVVPVEGVGETRRERVFEAVDPVAPRPLPAGSYVIEATAPGFMKATVPILLERLGREDVAVRLLRPVEIPPGFAYIPAGPFLAGSDGRAVRAQPRGRVEVPGFFLGSCEVSCAEYAEFLGSLPRDDALRLAPRGGAARGHALLFWPEGGAFRFPPAWPPERPVTGVPFEGALRYAIWRGAKDGRGPYRLPTELEWEKACRGADGRTWPWGEAAPAGRAVVSIEGRAVRPAAVGATPGDVSIYGVHDLAGNAAEWTSSNLDARLLYRIVRGGAYAPIPDEPLPAARFPTPVDDPPEYVGFRLACDLPE